MFAFDKKILSYARSKKFSFHKGKFYSAFIHVAHFTQLKKEQLFFHRGHLTQLKKEQLLFHSQYFTQLKKEQLLFHGWHFTQLKKEQLLFHRQKSKKIIIYNNSTQLKKEKKDISYHKDIFYHLKKQ